MAAITRSTLLVFFAFALPLVGQQDDTPLSKGVAAFKSGNYAEAIEDFRAAVATDPTSITPHLYLGTAYAYQVVPNDDSSQNIDLAHKAIDQLKAVPATDTEYYPNSLRQIGSVQRNIKDYNAARDTELKIIALAPDDAEAHYTLGVIDWVVAYRFATSTLAAGGLQDDGNGDPRMTPATCATIRDHNQAPIEEAIIELKKSIQLKPDYADAMSYLNLAYRRHADFACSNPATRKGDIVLADQWAQRAIAARKAQPQSAATAPAPQ
ncbi:MAG: tetratricopeptide repeat protein [Acidobacteriota bacterium]